MSATLEPIDVYREVTGIDELEAAGRPVLEAQFGLSFPEENRMSFSVEAPAFKYKNKGQPFGYQDNPRTDNEVRQSYAQAIYSVVQTTPGNVLIVMPSYSEAKWAGTLLKYNDDIEASRILIDESSSNTETEAMKRKFFRSDDAVLVTGALGTLTEGVDYKGDRLSAVVVCGVPIENTRNIYAKAVRTAYDFEFGRSNGFEYAFTVPAVHKVRQALGRVIRTDDDVGVRVLIDERYTENAGWDGVRDLLSPDERREFQDLDPDGLLPQLRGFWDFQQMD
jgi:DNA excision repair protein ERCC-2